MTIRAVHLIDVTLNNVLGSQAGTHSFKGVSPTKVSLYVVQVVTLSPTRVDYTVELSPDNGATLVSYDKLIDGAGVDAPSATIAVSGTADDVFSLSREDVVDYIRVLATGVGVDATNFFAVDVWLVYEY